MSGVTGVVTYNAGTADLEDLRSDRPSTLKFNGGDTSATLEVPIVDDDTEEEDETFTVAIDFLRRFTPAARRLASPRGDRP